MKLNFTCNIWYICNYNCSYCDTIKNQEILNDFNSEKIINFINKNYSSIESIKFFWWEPLFNWKIIKKIIDKTNKNIGKNFIIVTNTSFLNEEIYYYFKKYFQKVFLSVNTENYFDVDWIISNIKKYKLEDISVLNFIIDPEKIWKTKEKFYELYNKWYRNYNILPVYYTKNWNKAQLKELANFLKEIVDLSQKDLSINLFGFQENKWDNIKLIHNSYFIDLDWKIYYSDIVGTKLWEVLKEDLYIWDILSSEEGISFDNKNKDYYIKLEEFVDSLNNNIVWQKELQKIMDYFSQYLNKKTLSKFT